MKAKLLRNAMIRGEHKAAGKTVDVTKELHEELVQLGVVRDPNAPEVKEAASQAEAEAEAKAKEIVGAAEEKLAVAEKTLAEAEEQAKKVIADAEAEAAKLVAEAKAKTETTADKK